MRTPDPALIAEYERKLAEALSNGGSAWFDSWEDYKAWADWCSEQGYTLPLARSPEEALSQRQRLIDGKACGA